MNSTVITQLENVLMIPKNVTIKSQKLRPLTAPGENYGSLMLSVDVELESKNKIEKMSAVAKLVPPNDFIQTLFNTQVTFRNEIGFYKVIVPILQNFQKENGIRKVIEFTAKFLGGRLNLEDDSTKLVDNNAVLLLENLKIANFTTLNRLESLDLDVAKLVLVSLAELHAIALALKLHNPTLFEEKVKTYCNTWVPHEKIRSQMFVQMQEVVQKIEELKPFENRIRDGFIKMNQPNPSREPWSTVTHNDCWTNNIMIKLDNQKPVACKLVDFQLFDYSSPLRDIIFFLFSSVKIKVLIENYDSLVRFYYDMFISILKNLNCNVDLFTYASFLTELEHEAINTQFSHLFFMVFPILAPEESVTDVAEISPDLLKHSEITDLRKERFIFLVQEFAKRNWI